MLVDAICGVGLRTISYACKMERSHLAMFTGNQWNEEWEWDRERLEEMNIKELEDLYKQATSQHV